MQRDFYGCSVSAIVMARIGFYQVIEGWVKKWQIA